MATATTIDKKIEHLSSELASARRNEKELCDAVAAILRSWENLGLVLVKDIQDARRAAEQSNYFDEVRSNEETPESTASQA